jgi:hypothetical protein
VSNWIDDYVLPIVFTVILLAVMVCALGAAYAVVRAVLAL